MQEVAAQLVAAQGSELNAAEALSGARDIVAEELTEDAAVRAAARKRLRRGATLTCKALKPGSDGDDKYRLYHAFGAPLERAQPHQVLAINRGEAAEVLSASIQLDASSLESFESATLARFGPTGARHPSWSEALGAALADGTRRLLVPALEREWRRELTEAAEAQSFAVYATNLRQKLLLPPLKNHVVAAIVSPAALKPHPSW